MIPLSLLSDINKPELQIPIDFQVDRSLRQDSHIHSPKCLDGDDFDTLDAASIIFIIIWVKKHVFDFEYDFSPFSVSAFLDDDDDDDQTRSRSMRQQQKVIACRNN